MYKTNEGRRRVHKPPYAQYAILVAMLVWIVTVSILCVTMKMQLKELDRACNQLSESISSLSASIDELQQLTDDLHEKVIALDEQMTALENNVAMLEEHLGISSVDEYSENGAGAVDPATDTSNLSAVSNDTQSIYTLSSESERDLIERVVMSEAGNQSLEGQMAVAQCIQNTAFYKDMSASEVVLRPNQYASPYKYEVSQSVKDAVSAVFDNGEKAVEDFIMYFYAPKYGTSNWHENSPNLEYVTTLGDHKFFKLVS